MRRDPEKTSVRSIAQHLGLSPATVSLALNGRRPTSFVSSATRRQVWAAAKEMGYPIDRLRSHRPLLERVALFLPTGPNPVYSQTALVLCRDLSQHRVQIITHLTRTHRDAGLVAHDLHRRQEIDAAVFIGSREDLAPRDVPSVYVGEVPEGSGVWQVRADNEGGGRAVGEYLWSLGHRSLAVVMPARPNPAGELRLQGLQTFWREQGRIVPEDRVLRIDVPTASDSALRELVTAFLARDRETENPATAIFCFNDWVAGRVLKLLRSQGIRVPEEMSVAGYDDSIYAELLDPPLTTVNNPFDTLGAMAAELLMEQSENTDAPPRVLVASCRLIGRQSCAPPPLPPGRAL
jgi:LacI family transcriptional regulator